MLILLNRKKKENRCLFGKNRGVKVGKASFKNTFLIFLLYWPSFQLSKTNIVVCKKDYKRKSEGDNLDPSISIIDRDERIDNFGKILDIADTNNKDGRMENLGIGTNITDIDGRTTDLSININIVDINKKADNPDANINRTNTIKRVDNLGIGINIVDKNINKVADSIIGTDTADANVVGRAG